MSFRTIGGQELVDHPLQMLDEGVWRTFVAVIPRTNLCKRPKAALSAGYGYATATGGAVTLAYLTGVSDHPLGLTTAARATWTTAPTAGSPAIYSHQDYTVGLTAGTTITVSFWVLTSVTRNVKPQVDFYTAASAFVSGVAGTTVSVTGGVWTRLTVTAVVPATAERCRSIAFLWTTLPTIGETITQTGVLVEEAPYMRDYFDGSLNGAPNFTYAWSGTTDDSASTATPVS